MPYADKYQFLRLNTDDDDRMLQRGDFRDLKNGRIANTKSQDRGVIESIPGTTQIQSSDVFPSGTNRIIGAFEHVAENENYIFVQNSNNSDGVFKLDASGNITKVLVNNLGFSSDYPIYDVNFIDGELYFTDNLNHPRSIITGSDYPRGSDLEVWDTTTIKKPPMLPLTVMLGSDSDVSVNSLVDNSFQFAYRYVYFDKKVSSISPYSQLVPHNKEGDETRNYVSVEIPALETRPWGVTKTELLYRKGNKGRFYTWKEVAGSDTLHKFYNNSIGTIVPTQEEGVLFHDVPLKAKAQEIVKNRLFYGNYVTGFDMPSTVDATWSSTILVPGTTSFFAWANRYERVRYEYPGAIKTNLGLYVALKDGLYYAVTFSSSDGYWSQDQTDSDSPYTYNELVYSDPVAPYEYDLDYIGNNNIKFYSSAGENYPGFKRGGRYQGAFLYTDFGGRNAGVVTNDNWEFQIPNPYGSSDNYFVSWSLTSDSTIPDWAHYYYPMLTSNLESSFFVKGKTTDMFYHQEANGSDLFSNDAPGWDDIYIDVTDLTNNKIDYAYSEGDRIILRSVNGNDYDLKITGQSGRYVVTDNTYMGDFGSATAFLADFEIYTPRGEELERLYYEKGVGYRILNPGTSDRSHEILSGILFGDVYDVVRDHYNSSGGGGGYSVEHPWNNVAYKTSSDYTVQAMNPNDEFWSIWDTDAGRASVYDPHAKERRSTCNIKYSEQYAPDSRINNLHSFVSINRYDKIPETESPIVAFTAVHNVLISHHERNTLSIYIGEGFVKTVDGQEYLAKTDGVIDDHRILNGEFGALPMTIKKADDRIYFLDVHKGAVVRYTAAGTKSISYGEYSNERLFKDLSDTYRTNRGLIVGGYDPEFKEYLLTFPVINGVSTPKTYVFSETMDSWTGRYELMDGSSNTPTFYIKNANKMFSFLEGLVYKHNDSSTYNKFYGQQYNRYLKFVANPEASKTKVWNNIWIETDGSLASSSSLDVVTLSNVAGQSTYLRVGDFKTDEGTFKTAFKFDTNSGGLISGDRMRSKTATVEIETDLTTLNPLNLITVLFKFSEFTI